MRINESDYIELKSIEKDALFLSEQLRALMEESIEFGDDHLTVNGIIAARRDCQRLSERTQAITSRIERQNRFATFTARIFNKMKI